MSCKYYMLTDDLNFGQIIKVISDKEYAYYYGLSDWQECDILKSYFDKLNLLHNQYKCVSEERAFNLIDCNNEELRKLYNLSLSFVRRIYEPDLGYLPQYYDRIISIVDSLQTIESKVVAFLYECMINPVKKFSNPKDDGINNIGFVYRIVNSVNLLVETHDNFSMIDLLAIKGDLNALPVKIEILKYDRDTLYMCPASVEINEKIRMYDNFLSFLLGKEEMERSVYVM